jgi:hypothetical protein
MSTNDRKGSPSAAERMRLHRKRQRRGTRCVRLQLSLSAINALVHKGLLKNTDRDDPQALQEAVSLLISRNADGEA